MIKKIGASWMWIVLLFALTLIVRYYAIENAPFDKVYFDDHLKSFTNVECSGHNRFIATIWDEKSPMVHHYCLSFYPNDARYSPNKYDDSFETYTSFPPVAFLLPYFVSKIFGVSIDFYNRWMQIWSLLLNFLCAILIYQLAQCIIAPKDEKQRGKAMLFSLACVTIYLFNPNVLHFTSNVYWAHQFYEPVLLLFLLWLLRKDQKSRKLPVIFAWAFGLSFITWTGITTCGAWFLLELLLNRKEKSVVSRLAAIFGGTICALAVNSLWIGSTIEGGVLTMAKNLLKAFEARSVGEQDFGSLLNTMGKAIAWEYLPTLLFLLLCGGMVAFLQRKNAVNFIKLSKAETAALWISFLTCCESLILLEHDLTYGFGRYKYIVFLLVALMVIFKRLNALEYAEKKVSVLLGSLMGIVVAWDLTHYLMVYASHFEAYIQ